jgi:D-alanyl-D-alanine carboxypeptidase
MVMTQRILIALVLIGSTAHAAEPISDARFADLTKHLQKRLDDLVADRAFPGVSVGFVLPDGRSAGVAAGFADVEAQVPLKPTHRLLAGSIGKTYVAAVTLQLVEEGKLGLDDKVDPRLGQEAWYARLPNGRDLTLRHLLSHRTGLPEYFETKGVPDKLRADPDKRWTPADLIAFVLDTKPLFKAGEGYAYADTNYLLVGLVVEKVTGRPLFDEITRRLLKPLKLDRTIPSDRRELPDVAVGYSMPRSPFGIEGRMIVNGQFLLNPGFEYAGGGLASTPEDLAKWAQALYEGKAFKKKETLDTMLAGYETGGGRGGGKGVKYGLGVQIRDTGPGPVYGHGGWFPGYLSEVEYDPKLKIAVAVQFNTDAGRAIKKGVRAHLGDVTKVIRDAVER